MATFNGLDYAIFVLLFLSVAVGVARGFVKEVISFIAWVVAFTVATLYSVKFATVFPSVTGQVAGATPIESVSMVAIIISYVVLFFGILISASLIKLLVNYLVESSGLGIFNRLFGAVFGLARGCVIVLILMFFLAFTALSAQALWKDSKLVAVFHPGVKWMKQVTQPYLSQIEAKIKKTAKNLNQEDMSDIIKTKSVPAKAAPAISAPTLPASSTLPAATTTPSAAPAATPQTAPQTH